MTTRQEYKHILKIGTVLKVSNYMKSKHVIVVNFTKSGNPIIANINENTGEIEPYFKNMRLAQNNYRVYDKLAIEQVCKRIHPVVFDVNHISHQWEKLFDVFRSGDIVFTEELKEKLPPYYKSLYFGNLKEYIMDFIKACELGHLEVVKLLISKGYKTRNNSAIKAASRNGHLEVVKLLLKKGYTPKTHNNSALIEASENGHLEIVKLLILKGYNPKTRNNLTIKVASEYGHLEVVKLLLSKGCDPKAYDNYSIRRASENGHLEVVKLLLKEGCALKSYDNRDIQHASANGHLEVVKLLLENGRNPKADNNYAIQYASENGHLEVVKLLLTNGCYIEVAKPYILLLIQEEIKKLKYIFINKYLILEIIERLPYSNTLKCDQLFKIIENFF